MSTPRRRKGDNVRKESYKKTHDISSAIRHMNQAFFSQFKRNDQLSNKRTSIFNAESSHNQEQGNDLALDLNENEDGYIKCNYQTIGHILCCQCGAKMTPSQANMCKFCLRLECNVAAALPSRVTIKHCPDCGSYLQPPATWLKAERESNELLSFCLKRLKKLSEFRLLDARFLPTEPHCKRLQLRLKVKSELLDKVYSENFHDVEYIVRDKKCPACMPADPNQWGAVVQVRQHVSHMRTFLSLEQLIIKHNAAQYAVRIKPVKEGFYFGRLADAAKFYIFLNTVVPIQKCRFKKKLKSQDTKSNISRSEFAICATISPICHDDLVYLPSKVSARLGQFGPLVICTRVTNIISFLDPVTLQTFVLDAQMYWREPFEPLLSCKQLVEYIVLDVEVVTSEVESRWLGYTLADAEIARVSDFGKNDRISTVRTHLGKVLKPGDFALGYDLCGANFNNSEADERRASLPDAILIKKTYRDQDQQQQQQKQKPTKEKDDSEYERFKDDLLVNPELRFKLSLDDNEQEGSQMASQEGSGLDQVSPSELEDIFADLDLSDRC